MDFDPFLDQRLGIVGCRLAIDAALLRFLIVDLARLLGEFVADIFGVLFHRLAQFAHHLEHLLLARIEGGSEHRLRRCIRSCGCP